MPIGIDLAGSDSMATKHFQDGSGMEWRVWNTIPVSGAVINPGFEKGWLTFESDEGSLRRLAPIPSGWEDLPSDGLVALLRSATEVPRHTGPMRRVSRPVIENDASDKG